MTPVQRDQLATPVVLVYWLLLLGGLASCAALRMQDHAALMPVWVGAVAGTLLGQVLAMRDYRPWAAVVVVVVATGTGAQLVPPELAGRELWLAFVPATLCGFWSLGDRSAIAACWFPAVLWMLAILDRSDGTPPSDGLGIALLAGLAVLFFALLKVRESRRVSLWRSVAAVPLAPPRPVELLRTPPRIQLAHAGWGLAVSAITIAITAWVAPALWQIEAVERDVQRATAPRHRLPCCPAEVVASEGSRVKEYLDLGRGHGERIVPPLEARACRVCVASRSPGGERRPAEWDLRTPRPDRPLRGDDLDPAWPPLVEPSSPPPARPRRWTSKGSPIETELEPADPAAPPAVQHVPWRRAPVVPRVAPIAPPAVVPSTIEPLPVEPPAVVTAPPAAAPRAHIEPPARAPYQPSPPAASDADAEQARDAPAIGRAGGVIGPSVIDWMLVLATAALIAQLVVLALRPLRRLATLRHLRRPFWDETIAQRVSNAWQLALVGLRDAGWRIGHAEAPHEVARRTGVDGVASCATILERARHGIGIDPEDLAEMHASADTAYRAARRGLGRFARALSWLRWPLT